MKLGYTRMFNRFIAVLLVVSMLPLAALATALPEKAQADGAYEIVSSTQAPEGYVPKNEVLEPTTTSGTTDNDAPVKVLLIEDVLPWSSYANQNVLGGICEYKKTTTKNFLNENLEEYSVVIFANDQPFNTYENYAEFKEYLELFASLGGVIVFGACDAGWAGGNLNEKLPGDVTKKTHYVVKNHVADPTHLIVTGALTENDVLLDEDLTGSYCSHVSFNEDSLPAGSKIILREDDTNRPTLIEYPLGKGRVIASGLTWEFTYDRAGQYGSYGYIGYFARKAMEDMFRYAIRVSNIDVDELQLLEDWRIQKKAHTIVVADSSSGLDTLSPIAGATVRVEEPATHKGETMTTNDDGVVTTTDYGLRTVTVTATGYRDYGELYQVTEQTSRIIPLEKDKGDGLPYLSMCSAAKNGNQQFVDLRSQALQFTETKSDLMLLWLQGNWGNNGEGYFRVYQEAANGKPGKEFKVGVGEYLNIMPGKEFVRGVPVKIQMVSANGVKSEAVQINININKAPVVQGPTINTPIEEFTKVDWLGNYPIASKNDIFTKLLTTDMSVSSDAIPVEVAIEHNDDGTLTHKATIGFIKGEGKKNIKNEEDEKFGFSSSWKELKDQIDGYKKAGNPKAYWDSLMDKYGDDLDGTPLKSSVDVEIKFMGYFEVKTNQEGKIIESSGGIICNASASHTFGQTFLWGPVPLYYEFKPGVEFEISAGVTFYNEENGLTFKLNFGGIDLSIPTISLEGGVGVRGVASAGLVGTGKLKFGFLKDNAPVNVDLSLDGSVHIKVLFVADYKWSFASTNIHFYPKTGASSVAAAMGEMDESQFTLTSRSYLNNTTPWMDETIRLMDSGATTTLQQGTMPDAMPQIHQVNGKQIMVFLRDISTRETGNHTQLVYSVENYGVWSEPVPVYESATGDFFFNSAVCNGKLVVTWQKAKSSVQVMNAGDMLDALASNSEIYVATFDANTENFANVQCLTANSVVDMMPVVSSEGENIYISWVSNDENNVLGTGGKYHIYQATLKGSNVSVERLYSTTEYVVEIAAGGKDILIAVENAESSSDLYEINGKQATKISEKVNAAGLAWNEGLFTWQADGGLYGYDPKADTVETIIAPSVALSSSYEFINNNNRTAVIWTESTETGYQAKAAFRNDNQWSDPIVLLTGAEDTVSFMDAQMLNNDSISLVINTASYTDSGELGETSLQYANIVPQTNLSVHLAEPNYPDWDKQLQTIDVVLENTGEYPIYSIDLRVASQSGTLCADNLAVNLLPGETLIVPKELDISNISTTTELTVTADVNNDCNDKDNSQTFLAGKTDTSISVDTYIHGEEYLFVITASNASTTPANAALSIIEDNMDGVVLSMKNIGVVTNTDNIQYLYTLDRSKIDFADADTKTFLFTLAVLEEDWFDYDNVYSYTMTAPSQVETDPDGAIIPAEIVAPLSIDVAESTVVFDGVDSEKVQLHATVLPDNATNAKIFWEAENNSIVHVSEDGVVTPLKTGVTKITATVGEGITDTVIVSVGFIVGDLDGNQDVNNKDVEYLLWHTLFPDEYPLLQNADFDGNGSVNNKDVEYLLWHTLFPDSYPLAAHATSQKKH